MTVWLETETDYKVALRDGKVIALNKAGKELKTVPAKLKDDAVTQNLRDLMEWLEGHEREITAQITAWMVKSLPVSATVLAQVWQDESWRRWLTDLVILPCTPAGAPLPGVGATGFLRSAATAQDIAVVTLDGETEPLGADHLLIAHPIRLGTDLDDYRSFAADLGITQGTAQLMRETFPLGERPLTETSVRDFADGAFDALQHVTSRAQTLGYLIKGGYAVCNLTHDGVPLQASFWVGSGEPQGETVTGDLSWVRAGVSLTLAEVGAVAFSEGMRMAAALYAARKVDTEDENA